MSCFLCTRAHSNAYFWSPRALTRDKRNEVSKLQFGVYAWVIVCYCVCVCFRFLFLLLTWVLSLFIVVFMAVDIGVVTVAIVG